MQNEKLKTDKSINKDTNSSDIINVIKEDHKYLKKLISVMKNSERTLEERFAVFEEFAPLLVAHARPEEDIVYTKMKTDKDLRESAFEGDVEHGIADRLVAECKRTLDKDLLSARIKVLAELVEHHIEEEEGEMLPGFKKKFEAKIREQLGKEFLASKVDYLAEGEGDLSKVAGKAGEFHH